MLVFRNYFFSPLKLVKNDFHVDFVSSLTKEVFSCFGNYILMILLLLFSVVVVVVYEGLPASG